MLLEERGNDPDEREELEMDSKNDTQHNRAKYSKLLAGLLLALLLSFASLVPGGPVENRDFSHLSRLTFNGFNAFLIALGLIGFLTVYGLWRGHRRAYWLAILVGWTYVAVVVLDLGKVFPVSPDPTGFSLGMIMILDSILGLNVVLFSYKALGHI
jgi:uncharacterized membrane protein (DUF2068 family)